MSQYIKQVLLTYTHAVIAVQRDKVNEGEILIGGI